MKYYINNEPYNNNGSKEFDCIASIVLYKNPFNLIKRTIKSFLNTQLKVKLYLIDNSPTPELRRITNEFEVEYYFTHVNLGYGKGHNLAISKAENSKYYLILNPDVYIPEGTLEELIRFMDKSPDIGIVCPKIIGEDGNIQYQGRREPTVLDLFIRRFISKKLKPFVKKRLDYYEMRNVESDDILDVPFISGAFMLCRFSALKEVGGFDKRYFLYFEDADLTKNFKIKGWKTVYYPNRYIIHTWERGAYKNWKMMLIFIINGIKYFNKWGWKFY